MRVVDASILLAANNSDHDRHAAARTALQNAINDAQRSVGLPWVSINAFLRISTKPNFFPTRLTVENAWGVVNRWLAHPNVKIVQETDEHARIWAELLRHVGTGGDLTTDAWIAAIAIAHGATVLTIDSDFTRFSGLRWEIPTLTP